MMRYYGKKFTFLSEDQSDNTRLAVSTELLAALKALGESRMTVVVMIGPARRGKSLTINALAAYVRGRCRLAGVACPDVIEQMVTSDSAETACTHGAEALLLPDFRNDGGTIMLVDCEGSDLGNQTLHDKLYTIALLVASELTLMAEGVLDNRVLVALGRLATTGALFKDGEWPGLSVLVNKMTNVLPAGTTADQVFQRQLIMLGDANDLTREIIQKRFKAESRWAAMVRADTTANETREAREQLVRDALSQSPDVDGGNTERQLVRDFRAFAQRLFNERAKAKMLRNMAASAARLAEFIETGSKAVNDNPALVNMESVVAMIQRRMCKDAAEKAGVEEYRNKLPAEEALIGDEAQLSGATQLEAAALRVYDEATREMLSSVREEVRAGMIEMMKQYLALLLAKTREIRAGKALEEARRAVAAAQAAAEDAKKESQEAQEQAKLALAKADASAKEAEAAKAEAKSARTEANNAMMMANRGSSGGGGCLLL